MGRPAARRDRARRAPLGRRRGQAAAEAAGSWSCETRPERIRVSVAMMPIDRRAEARPKAGRSRRPRPGRACRPRARRWCGCGERHQRRDAERAADLLAGVDQAGGHACVAILDARSAAIVTGTNENPRPTPASTKPGDEVDQVRAVGRDQREPGRARSASGAADHQHGAHADARHERLRGGGADDDRDRHGQVAEAGAQRRVARAPAACRGTGRRTSRRSTRR